MTILSFLGRPNVQKLQTKRDVAGLAKALAYQRDSSVRLAAASALGAIRDTSTVQPLKDAIRDSDPAVRFAAIAALGDIFTPEAVASLSALLDGSNADLRLAAANALDHSETDVTLQARCAIVKQDWPRVDALGPKAVKPLIATLKDEEADIRLKAAELLGRIGDQTTIAPLCNVLNDSHFRVRQAAADALASLGNPEATDALARHLKDYEIWPSIMHALVKVCSPSDVLALIPATHDSSHDVRQRAARVLGEIGGEVAVNRLVVMLIDPHPNVRMSAADALSKIGDKQAVGPVVEVLKSDDLAVRRAAAQVLAAIGVPDEPLVQALFGVAMHRWDDAVALGPFAIDPLVASLASEDPDTRKGASAALVQIGEPTLPDLVKALSQSNPVVRRAAVDCICQIGIPADPETRALLAVASENWGEAAALGEVALAPLTDALKSSSHLETQKRIIAALAQLGSLATESLCFAVQKPDLTPSVVEALDTIGWQPDTSIAAAYYWAHKGSWDKCTALGATAAPALMRVLDEQNSERVRGAASAVTALGSEDALDWLIQALRRSSNMATRVALRSSMKAITGTDLGDDPDAWYRWLNVKRDPLAKKLMSGDLATFKSGRDEGLSRAQRGDKDVLDLIEDIIRTRFGKSYMHFYREDRMPEILKKHPVYFQFDADRTYAGLQSVFAMMHQRSFLDSGMIRNDPLHAQAVLISLLRKPMYVEGLMLTVLSDSGTTAAIDLSLLLLDIEVYSILNRKGLA